MGCHSDCRDAFCDHGGCMGCGHDPDCCPECAMPNADQRACLTLEYRDNVCEHCLGPTNDPTAPHYYDSNHRAASGTPAGYVGAWAIWCGRPCGPDCSHEGQMKPLVRDTKREERIAFALEASCGYPDCAGGGKDKFGRSCPGCFREAAKVADKEARA